jgi:transcription initiation factor TFIIE subunit alpha
VAKVSPKPKAPKGAKPKRIEVKRAKAAPKAPSFLESPLLTDVLHQIAGDSGLAVLKSLHNRELTDEDLAKRTGLSINLVRRILYDLYENQVVSYRRERDEESGWYIYFWRFNPERAIDFIRHNRQELLRKLEEKLEQERSTIYFSCGDECQKVPFPLAAENDFKCPACGGELKPYDNSSYIAALERRVQQLREQLLES